MNLANLAISGLQVAQNRLQTAGHNINNAATPGYNRQSVVVGTASARHTGAGWVGMGVQGYTVSRAYDNFLYRQLLNAQNQEAALTSYRDEITQINNLFSDRTVGIHPALQQFFDGLQAVASAPADPAARQELLGRAASLAGQLNDADAFFQAQRGHINTQITTTVEQVNSLLNRVHDLNQQIITARGASGEHQPNDLLDKRDQLLAELGELIDVNVLDQDGSVSLTIGNGQVLLGGNTVFPLHAVASKTDPSRLVLAHSAPASGGQIKAVALKETAIKGGKLGGLLRYRSEALDALQSDLGRLATSLALSLNQQHQAGYDAGGNPGQVFFDIGSPKVNALDANQTAVLQVEFAQPAANQQLALTGHDYIVQYDGQTYTLINAQTEAVVAQSNQANFEADGLLFSINGNAQAGDAWSVQPTRGLASSFKLALQQADHIAAAETPVGDSDGGNALKLAQLQNQKVLAGGTASFNESFSQIINKTGVLTQQNATALEAQHALVRQNYAAQQAVSGVNIDEELAMLDRYQEQYRAAARLIDVSASLFDTLLTLGR